MSSMIEEIHDASQLTDGDVSQVTDVSHDADESEIARKLLTTSGKKKKKNYPQRYRESWESYDEFKYWLKPYPKDNTKAFCSSCHSVLFSKVQDLRKHGESRKHKKILEAKLMKDHKKNYLKNEVLMKRERSEDVGQKYSELIQMLELSDDEGDSRIRGLSAPNPNKHFLLSLLQDMDSMTPSQIFSFKFEIMKILKCIKYDVLQAQATEHQVVQTLADPQIIQTFTEDQPLDQVSNYVIADKRIWKSEAR